MTVTTVSAVDTTAAGDVFNGHFAVAIAEGVEIEKAIQSAKDQYEGTKYLTDVSIDDRTEWEIGYSRQCITVEGIAHR